jgi:hypothetical protein
LEPLILLQRVREVAALADPTSPATVSQRAFDAAAEAVRSGSANGTPVLPAARNIAKTLRLAWREVVTVAHEPEDVQNHRLSLKAKTRAPEQDWLTDEYISSVLRLAAHRLGADTLTPNRYRVVAAEMRAADRTRWLHGGQLLVPSDDQIVAATGSWDRALALARLAPRPGLGDQGLTAASPPITDLLERFYEAHGAQPSARDLKAFARANGIPYPRETGRTWNESVMAWKQSRRDKGLPVPDRTPPPKERADYGAVRGASAAHANERRRTQWTVANCVNAVARYLAHLPAGQRSTKRDYYDWARGQDDAPAPSIFDGRGGWEAIRRKAEAAISSESGTPITPPARPRSLLPRQPSGAHERQPTRL